MNTKKKNSILFIIAILLLSALLAGMLSSFLASEFGYPHHKNIIWTTGWICLTIISWTYVGAKALIPYPTFVLISLATRAVLPYNLVTVSILGLENLGGIILFLIYYVNAEKKFLSEQEKVEQSNKSKTTSLQNTPNIVNTKLDRNNELKENKTTTQSTQSKRHNNTPVDTIVLEDETVDKFYDKAFDELESQEFDKTVIAKAISVADGDPKKERSAYIRMRVEQLRKQHQLEKQRELTLETKQSVLDMEENYGATLSENELNFNTGKVEKIASIDDLFWFLQLEDRRYILENLGGYCSLLIAEEKNVFSYEYDLPKSRWSSQHELLFSASLLYLVYKNGIDKFRFADGVKNNINGILKTLPSTVDGLQLPRNIKEILIASLDRNSLISDRNLF
jgi:hypothetical protein